MVPNLNALGLYYRVFPAMSTCLHGYTMWLVCAHSKKFQTPRGLSVWSLHGLHLGVGRNDLTAMIWPLVRMWMVVFEAREELASRPHSPLARRQLGSFFGWKYGILKPSFYRSTFTLEWSIHTALTKSTFFSQQLFHTQSFTIWSKSPKRYFLKLILLW